MAKNTNRISARDDRARERERDRGRDGDIDGPGPIGGPRDDVQRAIEAGREAEAERNKALKAMENIAKAAADAREAIYCALRAAEYAEVEAGRVLEDARRMMHAARVRAEKVRTLFRTEEAIADDFDGGELAIDQARQGEARAIESSLRAVGRAMQAAKLAHNQIDRDQSDLGGN